MKKAITLLVGLSMFAQVSIGASTWIVQEYGCNCQVTSSPSVYQYSSINGVTTNASLAIGDTILIRNREGDLPWAEAVTINKSVTIAPYYNDSVFYCQGVWTIAGGSLANATINIIGMYNNNGYVTTSAASGGTASTRCTVRLHGGQLGTGTTSNTSGYINFNQSSTTSNYYDLWVEGMKIINGTSNPSISFQHGSIIGDSIYCTSEYGIYVANDAGANADTSFILGNIIDYTGSCVGYSGIYWDNNQITFDMRNNLVYSADYYGIYAQTTKAAATPVNKLFNNTIVMTGAATSCSFYGMYLAPNTTGPAVIEVQNNVLARTTTTTTDATYGIYSTNTTGQVKAYYNFIDSKFTTAVTNLNVNTNNNTSLAQIGASLGTGAISTSFPPTSGSTQATTSLGYFISTVTTPVNAGNPGFLFNNIVTSGGSTTQNTAGCYGGPFALQNYFPLTLNTGPTRIYTTTSNATSANINSTFYFNATSYDR